MKKPKWKPLLTRQHIYLPDAAELEPKIYPTFLEVLKERGSVVEVENKDIKSGLFGKKRSSLYCRFGDHEGWITAIAMGPDLYLGSVLRSKKKELSDVDSQDLEAFGEYLAENMARTLGKLGFSTDALEGGE
jgi:hypothetical protein